MKFLGFSMLVATTLLVSCDDTPRGPVGSSSGREKGTPSAAAGTPAQGGAPAGTPAQGGAAGGTTVQGGAATEQQPKPAEGAHGR